MLKTDSVVAVYPLHKQAEKAIVIAADKTGVRGKNPWSILLAFLQKFCVTCVCMTPQ